MYAFEPDPRIMLTINPKMAYLYETASAEKHLALGAFQRMARALRNAQPGRAVALVVAGLFFIQELITQQEQRADGQHVTYPSR